MSDTLEKIHAQIGEVKTGKEGQMLTAILGSCIGLGFINTKRGLYGLAHCLLPRENDPSNDAIGARNVEQAVRSLASLLEITPENVREFAVILAGGANMTNPNETDPKKIVGSQNSRNAYKAVRKLGVFNITEDLGGSTGRQVNINCNTGEYEILQIPRYGK